MKLTKVVALWLGMAFPGSLVIFAAPGIITQPEPQTVPAGYPAYFAVEATNSVPMAYYWFKNGVGVAGANTNFYFTPAVALGDNNAVFTVIVSNSTGYVTSSNGVLTVMASVPTVFTLPPFYTCSINYYVATNGSDTNTAALAQNPNTPWKTIGNALTVLQNQGGTQGGVCVNVGNGVYNEAVNNSRKGFNVSGSSDTTNGYFVLRSQNPHGAMIMVPSNAPDPSDAIRFTDAKYVVIDGFVLAGDHSQANIDGAGIKITGTNFLSCISHHYRIYNNLIYGFGGPAIHGLNVDYVEQRNNVCFSSSATYTGGSSGIDYYQPVALDSGMWNTVAATNASFHIIIGDNISFNNFECNIGRTHGDGNGIICDDFNCTQTNGEEGIVQFTNRTLIEGNLAFDNGGAGVALGGGCTSYATIRNNTCFNDYGDDNISSSWRAEIKIASVLTTTILQTSHDNTVVNNIARAEVGTVGITRDNAAIADVSTDLQNTNNVYLNNLTFNGTAGQASLTLNTTASTVTSTNGNLLGIDPKFNSETNFDFTLQSASPAIDASTNAVGLPAYDLNGQARPLGAAVDLGAYEYVYGVLINSIARQGTSVKITFVMGPGRTNALQAVTGGHSGGIPAGGFTNIFIVATNAYAGAVTNFTEAGVLTNFTSRYYRTVLVR